MSTSTNCLLIVLCTKQREKRKARSKEVYIGDAEDEVEALEKPAEPTCLFTIEGYLLLRKCNVKHADYPMAEYWFEFKYTPGTCSLTEAHPPPPDSWHDSLSTSDLDKYLDESS